MTENMKLWLKNLYEEEAKDHLETAKFEHLCALGSEGEAAVLHAQNSIEHVEFADMLTQMANDLEV